ncbi:hypothetical protein N825_34220 [Skermanella stibiiresistens SB22]|uniref:Conjugal transfer protein TraA n=1 Tax=Skermanella stibiiresistens SB22 TaxID=1385369 RepID=W9GPY2_9PROT|nr:TraA family conjugative transfer protein [Skermanella stibiiresistens]EWY35819.1 hypothetical protein N825_34220 [Skermanella stibiiresistens SB22]
MKKKHVVALGLLGLAVVLALAPTDAFAGTGGSAFDDVYTTIKDWTSGYLGKSIALGLVLYGVGAGVAKQSLGGFATGMGGGVGLNYAPDVVESVVSATLPVAQASAEAMQLVVGVAPLV